MLFGDVVDPAWHIAQGEAIAKVNSSVNPSIAADPFQKRLAQAFAEASKGDAYVCTPEDNAPDNQFDKDLAWGGWEYPALTRNHDVTKIIRLDPSTTLRGKSGRKEIHQLCIRLVDNDRCYNTVSEIENESRGSRVPVSKFLYPLIEGFI